RRQYSPYQVFGHPQISSALFSDGHCGGPPGMTGRPASLLLEFDVVEQRPVERADLEAGGFVRDRVYPQPAGRIDRNMHGLGQQYLEHLVDLSPPPFGVDNGPRLLEKRVEFGGGVAAIRAGRMPEKVEQV